MIYLASQSPRRAELLRQIGVSFQRFACDIDEAPFLNEKPAEYVLRMAKEKASEGWRLLLSSGGQIRPLLASDTTIALDGQILGKPEDEHDAKRILRLLSGKKHEVMTAIVMTDGQKTMSELVITGVVFKDLTEKLINNYIASGEPFDKAGAYAIQGYGAILVTTIAGSFSAVVGLPLMETSQLLAQFDIPVWNAC